jgi:hypothetical protein
MRAEVDKATHDNAQMRRLGSLGSRGLCLVLFPATMIARPNGTFYWGSAVSTAVAPTSLSLADVNSDGLLDVVGIDPTTAQASVFTGNGGGQFKSS